ncbi:unnamed protein product [Acidocella sp. C78]|nr:unnamed protein product [Acidocella sp. C78]
MGRLRLPVHPARQHGWCDTGRSPGSRLDAGGPAFPNRFGFSGSPLRGGRTTGSPLTVAGAAIDLLPGQ